MKRQQSEHKSKLNKITTRTGSEQMSVIVRLDLDLPEAILTVSCLHGCCLLATFANAHDDDVDDDNDDDDCFGFGTKLMCHFRVSGCNSFLGLLAGCQSVLWFPVPALRGAGVLVGAGCVGKEGAGGRHNPSSKGPRAANNAWDPRSPWVHFPDAAAAALHCHVPEHNGHRRSRHGNRARPRGSRHVWRI